MRFEGKFTGQGWSTDVVGFDAAPLMHLNFPEFGVYAIVNLGSAELYTDGFSLRDKKDILSKIKTACSSFVGLKTTLREDFSLLTIAHEQTQELIGEPIEGNYLGAPADDPDYMFYDMSDISAEDESMVVVANSNLVGAKFTAWDKSFSIDVELKKDKHLLYNINNKTRAKIFLEPVSLVSWEDDYDESKAEEYLVTLDQVIEKAAESEDKRDFSWLYDKDYIVVEPDPGEFKTRGIPDFSKAGFKGKEFEENKKYLSVALSYLSSFDILSFDTETTGLNFSIQCLRGDYDSDTLVGFSFTPKDGESFYFPLDHKVMENLCDSDSKYIFLHRKIKNLLETKKIICHNIEFDWRVMWTCGISVNCVFDTLAAFRASVGTLNPGYGFSLKKLAERHLNRSSLELSDIIEGSWGDTADFRYVNSELARYYVGADTDNTFGLYLTLKGGILKEYGSEKIATLESKFAVVIGMQRFYGHHTPMNKVPEVGQKIENDLEALLGEIREYLIEYNLMSSDEAASFKPSQAQKLGMILFSKNKMGLPSMVTTNTGNPSTNSKALKPFLRAKNPDGSPKYPFVNMCAEWKDVQKMASSFTNADKLRSETTKDGLRFSEVKQFLETGRVSTSEPNYQSYDDRIKGYITPRPGYYAADADYSSVEYRIMACMALQNNLIEEFWDPDMDIHRLQAAKLFDKPYDKVTPQERKLAKGLNFGLAFGMGDQSLGAHLWGERTAENTAKAAQMRKKFFENQEGIENLFAKSGSDAQRLKYAPTFFGRRRYFVKKYDDAKKIHRMGGNHRIQGTAADLYKMAMVRLFTEIQNRRWMGRVFIDAFVHDEAYMEVHSSINPGLYVEALHKSMMMEIDGWCPLYLGMGFGETWYSAKSVELPVQVQNTMKENVDSHYGGLEWWKDRSDLKDLSQMMSGSIANHYVQRLTKFIKEGNVVKTLPTYVQEESVFLIDMVQGMDEEEDKGIIQHVNLPVSFEEFKESLSDVGSNVGEKFRAIGSALGLGSEAESVLPDLSEAEVEETEADGLDEKLGLSFGQEEEDPLKEYKAAKETQREAAESAMVVGYGRTKGSVFINLTHGKDLYEYAKNLSTEDGTVLLANMTPKSTNIFTDPANWSIKKFTKGKLTPEAVERVTSKFIESLQPDEDLAAMLEDSASEEERVEL